MNSEQSQQYIIKYYTLAEIDKMAQQLKATVVFKKEHTKVFNKKTQEFKDDYPLDKYLIKNSHKIILYTQVKGNLYAILVEKSLLD